MGHFRELWGWLMRIKKPYYLLIGAIVYLVFFDSNSVLEGFSLESKVRELEKSIEIEEAKIRENEERISKVLEDDEALERFARERYLMHGEEEDLFIIEKK